MFFYIVVSRFTNISYHHIRVLINGINQIEKLNHNTSRSKFNN